MGNAALFLGSLFLLGQLPARMLGIDGSARNDNQEDVDYTLDNDDYYNEDSNLGHRQGLLAPKAKPKPLFKMPKLKFVNPFRKFRRNLKQKFRKRFMKRRRHRRPLGGFGGMRRLKKKSGRVGPIREFTYRKPGGKQRVRQTNTISNPPSANNPDDSYYYSQVGCRVAGRGGPCQSSV